MSPMNRIPDRTLLQKINQRLMRTGLGSQSKIKLTIRNGDVTLAGTLQYENQRRPVLAAARGVEGVRTVIDNLQIQPRLKRWQ